MLAQQLPCDVLCARLGPSRTNQLVGYGGRDGIVYVYPFAAYTPSARLQGLSAAVTAVAFDAEQSVVAGGADNGGLRMWNVATEQPLRVFGKGHNTTITALEVHKSGQFIASVSTDTNLRIWDVRKSSGLQSYKDASAPLCAVQFSPDGKWVATGCAQGVVRLYNLTAARSEGQLCLHTGAITSLHFHPDLYYLAVGSGDGTLSIWNLETRQSEFQSHSLGTPVDAVRFSGRRLIAASDHTLHAYDMANLCNSAAQRIAAPWTMVGDLAFTSFADEALFVEFAGTSSTVGKLPLTADEQAGTLPPLNTPAQARAIAAPDALYTDETARRAGTTGASSAATATTTSGLPPRRGKPAVQTGGRLRRGERFADSRAEPEPESEVVLRLLESEPDVEAVMHRRLTHLRVLHSLWPTDQKAALQHLLRVCADGTESGVAFDFVRATQQPQVKEKIAVEVLPDFLDVLLYLLASGSDAHLLVALDALRGVNTKFRARVEEVNRRAQQKKSIGFNDPLGAGSAREVMQKLGMCGEVVLELADQGGDVGAAASALLPELPPPQRT